MRSSSTKQILRYVQAALYVLAGCNHFWRPHVYAAIVPPPFPAAASVISSGIAEIILGILLIFSRTARLAAMGIVVLLIAIFPANIYMAIQYIQLHHRYAWLTITRLPIQFILIWLAIWSTKPNRN